MTIQFDTFFPQKGFNKQFNIIENCEFEPNPRGVGFDADKIFWRKRDGITTDSNGNWDTTGDIKQMKEFSGDIILYTDNPEVYSFDGSNLSNLSISGIDYDSSKYNQIFNTSYLGGGRYPDDTTTYTIDKYNPIGYILENNGELYKVDVVSGDILKNVNDKNGFIFGNGEQAIEIDSDFNVYIIGEDSSSGDRYLLKYDFDLNLQWSTNLDNVDTFSAYGFSLYQDTPVVGFFYDGTDYYFQTFDTSDGTTKTKTVVRSSDPESNAIVGENNIIFNYYDSGSGTDKIELWSYPGVGSSEWTYDTGATNTIGLDFGKRGYVYIKESNPSKITKLNISDGTSEWSKEIEGVKDISSVVELENGDIVTSNSYSLFLISGSDGTILKEKVIDELLDTDVEYIVLDSNEYVYVCGYDYLSFLKFDKDLNYQKKYDIDTSSDFSAGLKITKNKIKANLELNQILFKEDLVDDTGTTDPTAYIGKYMYIRKKGDKGENESQYQWRYVNNVLSDTDGNYNKSLLLDRKLIIDANDGDEVVFYNQIQNQQWFPQLRNSSNTDQLLARDSSGNTMFWNFPDAKKIVQYDGRIFKLPSNGKGVVPSYPSNYEIFDAQRAIEFYEEEILNIESFGGMIIVFFENKIGIISKTVINSDTGQYYYSYRDIIAIGPYSKNSYHLSDNGFYFFGRDKVLYSIGVEVDDTGKIQTFPNNIGMLLESYFDNFSGGEVFINYDFGRLWLIYKNSGQTDIFKYYNNYEGWIRDFYQIGNQFAETTIKYGNERFSMNNNQIVKWSKDVLTDLGNNFIQGLKVYGPEKGMMQVFNLTRIKIRLGFDGIRQIGGKTYVVVGANNKANVEGNIDNVKIISDINEYVSSNETMGSSLLGSQILGGDSEDSSNYDEIIDLTQNIGKTGQYYSIEIYNDEAKQMYFGGLITEYSSIIERSSVSFPSNYF